MPWLLSQSFWHVDEIAFLWCDAHRTLHDVLHVVHHWYLVGQAFVFQELGQDALAGVADLVQDYVYMSELLVIAQFDYVFLPSVRLQLQEVCQLGCQSLDRRFIAPWAFDSGCQEVTTRHDVDSPVSGSGTMRCTTPLGSLPDSS